jgi:aspartyl-tRNA(Asn)/glutamyl-tRNA(Gln) amidotransferase subunit A
VSSNLAKFDAMRYGLRVGDDGVASAEQVMAMTREAGFGAEVKRRDHYRDLRVVQWLLRGLLRAGAEGPDLDSRDFDKAFSQVDVLVSPSTPITAFKIGEKVDDPLAMYMNDLCTIPSNLGRQRQRVLPGGAGTEDGLPLAFR